MSSVEEQINKAKNSLTNALKQENTTVKRVLIHMICI